MKINSIEILAAHLALKEPYILSFATVEHIDSIVVRLGLDNGNTGFSETVPLPGYSHETKESIVQDLKTIMPGIVGLDSDELHTFLQEQLPSSPFAVSAVITASEVAAGQIKFPERIEVPLLAPVSADRETSTLLQKVESFITQGYETIKLKVGRDIEADKKSVKILLKEIPAHVKIRIDANQAYSFKQATDLIHTIESQPNHQQVELFEQPFGTGEDDWETFRKLAAETSNVALMLDESIIEDHHVDRAAEVGASFVKLKLFKQAGVKGLCSLAEHARKLGLQVVLGNGVSTEIGNILEGVAYMTSGLFAGASEGNGFEKLICRVIHPEVLTESGRMIWIRDGKPFSASLSQEHFTLLARKS